MTTASRQGIDNFVTKYKQPFSLQMAVELDVQTLTNEMGRLEDSISRLVATQEVLKEVIDTGDAQPDPEITQAYDDNVEVIGSQRERIRMIKLALEAKGVSAQSLSHYLGRESVLQENGPEQADSTDGGIDL